MAEVGSTGSVDKNSEDFGRDTFAAVAGIYANSSEVRWMQQVAKTSKQKQKPQSSAHGTLSSSPPQGEPTPSWLGPSDAQPPSEQQKHPSTSSGEASSSEFSYHLDDLDLPVPDQSDELNLPPMDTANRLANAYFETVHPAFPLVLKHAFFSAYEQCFEPYGLPPSRRWRAVINLIFAIGAKYSVITQVPGCEESDHLTFFSRARSLSFDSNALLTIGDMEQVQVVALTALYLLATDHINRYVRVVAVLCTGSRADGRAQPQGVVHVRACGAICASAGSLSA